MLDPDQDPDRYDAARDPASTGPLDPASTGPLDPERDPDRYRGATLPGLLGEGAQEGERDNLAWLVGLVSVLGFLLLVSVLLSLRS